MNDESTREAALKFAVYNAVTYEGRAQIGSVMGRIMAEFPALRSKAEDVSTTVREVVSEVNSWSREKQNSMLMERWPELLEQEEKEEEKKGLPPLENVDRFEMVRTRFAPNPDGALHLGSAEPIIFCDEYAKMYDGNFILRYEDTSPDVKTPILEMYEWINEDLEWLGVKVDEVYIQSDRLEIYYKYAVKLIKMGEAYVCTCKPKDFKRLYMAKEACPCRDLSPEENLGRWRKMLDGSYQKGEAVVRIKTELDHPNPAIRDWPALRIVEGSHPRVGDKYKVWPLYNFSCAIDDHELEISHIIRGKEHEVNTTRQRYISEHLSWEFPEIINIGRLGLEVGVLSKSKIRGGIEAGEYTGWDDPRLGTLRSLKRRGLQPEAIREIMIQVGPKPINVTLSWDHIASVNRGIIEYEARRYYFVKDPVPLTVSGIEDECIARLPRHPDRQEWGNREYTISPSGDEATFVISRDDLDNLGQRDVVRLMGLVNIEILGVTENRVTANYHSQDHQRARELDIPFIHWLPAGVGIEARVVMPDASSVNGLAEEECRDLKEGTMIQFERFGFVRVDESSPFVAYYAHR
ncbi:MAG: glutamate--tRNA ligase [Candidatus Bathyarchaeota archaeon]|jgi:glutamyl-tRNA synthetase